MTTATAEPTNHVTMEEVSRLLAERDATWENRLRDVERRGGEAVTSLQEQLAEDYERNRKKILVSELEIKAFGGLPIVDDCFVQINQVGASRDRVLQTPLWDKNTIPVGRDISGNTIQEERSGVMLAFETPGHRMLMDTEYEWQEVWISRQKGIRVTSEDLKKSQARHAGEKGSEEFYALDPDAIERDGNYDLYESIKRMKSRVVPDRGDLGRVKTDLRYTKDSEKTISIPRVMAFIDAREIVIKLYGFRSREMRELDDVYKGIYRPAQDPRSVPADILATSPKVQEALVRQRSGRN